MKVALVYDRVNKWGGAERVLLALHEIWPEAPLYTAVYDQERASWAKVFDIRASFLNYLPFASSHHELYPWLTPLAFETFNFDEFDAVISVTSAEAKNIITKPHTLHICYCLTPTRYLWSGYKDYLENPGLGKWGEAGRTVLKYLAPTLRRWDLVAASRPDYYLAISEHVKKRIEKYYQKRVEKIIYPPVDIEKFKTRIKPDSRLSGNDKFGKDYFLVVSRLVGYKRVDLIIDAFNKLNWPLIIIGDGLARKELQSRAGKNIQFITDNLTESELVSYYEKCRAIVIAAEEDFGLTSVEALASGIPVIAYKQSGASEAVTDGKTGILFARQNRESLIAALRKFDKMQFDQEFCRSNALRFDQKCFEREIKETVQKLYNEYNAYNHYINR